MINFCAQCICRIRDILEIILSALPLAANLDLHLDTSIHLLRSTLVVYAELDNIAILSAKVCLCSPCIGEIRTLIGNGRDSVPGFESRM